MKGSETCETPRLNARILERTIIEQLRRHILTESNIRDLAKMVDEEMDGLDREQRPKSESVETTDLEMSDAADRIHEHKQRKEPLEVSADEARRTLAERRQLLDAESVIAALA